MLGKLQGFRMLTAAAVVVAGAAMWSCREDVFVEPPPSLIGSYKGFIYLRTEVNGIVTLEKAQHVNWTFSDVRYRIRWDSLPNQAPLSAAPNERQFCDSDGEYDLSAGIELIVIDPSPTPVVCIESQNPEGFFSLDQSDPDTSVKINQRVQVSAAEVLFRQIRLFRQ